MNIKKCFVCDSQPVLDYCTICLSQGFDVDEHFVRCSCGLRGKSFLAMDCDSKSLAIDWWNKFVDDYYDGYPEFSDDELRIFSKK